ncbi:MAG: hypothetical protein IJK23_14230 [Clostridia bacterium]|nr:hypothetical protein [Clostridia bacterium]
MCWTSRKYGVQVNYTAATDWETENNDSGSRADEIKVNQKYNGALTYFYMDNDVDYYKFTTTEKGCARLTFTHASINDDEIFWIVTLYDAEFNQLTSIDVSGKKSAVSSAYVGIPAGTYYVYVEGWEECEDMYGIQVAFTASSIWETELNDSSATADTIVKNKTYNGSLATDNDTDYYKFVMKTTDYASFTFKHTSFNEGWSFWYVTLYDKDFNEIKCLESTGKKATVYTSLVKLKKGTYYIVVEKDSYSSRTYSLRVRSAYTVKYHSTASSAASGTVTKVKYGVSTKTKTVEQLKFSVSGKTFAGWRVYREYDGKWAATKTGSDKLEWVALTNGKLPSGYSYKLYENGESVAKTAPSGVVHFYGQWK